MKEGDRAYNQKHYEALGEVWFVVTVTFNVLIRMYSQQTFSFRWYIKWASCRYVYSFYWDVC